MIEFKCSMCETTTNSGGFVTSHYESWVNHLLSSDHQNQVKRKQNEMKKWRDEQDSFVLSGMIATETNGFPWKITELAEWLSSFGVITQFLYNERYCFCIFTLQGFGKIGRDTARSVTNQTEFQGHTFSIKRKDSYGPNEWNSVYQRVDCQQRSETEEVTTQSTAVATKTVAKCTSTTQVAPYVAIADNIHKETLIFTNTNLFSTKRAGAPKPIGLNIANCSSSSPKPNIQSSAIRPEQNNERRTPSNSFVPKGDEFNKKTKRQRFKERKRQKEPLQTREEKSSTSVSIIDTLSRSSTCSVSSSGMDTPSTSQIDSEKKGKESNQMTPQNSLQQPVSFNFRGGFTPFGRKCEDYKVVNHSDVPVDQLGGTMSACNSSSTPTKTPEGRIDKHSQSSQKLTETRVQQNKYPKNPPGSGNGNRPHAAGYPPLPHHMPRPQTHRVTHHSRPFESKGFIGSPAFTSQITPAVAATLSNPYSATSRNPYKFNNVPPFSHFFDLFRKLPEESFKQHKEVLFKQFQALTLSDQLEEFFEAQTLPFDEIRLRWQVILDILFLLRQHFPRCELYAFGSIITNLNDFMSDIDVYVDLEGDSTSSQPVDPSRKMTGHQAVTTLKKIFWKSVCPHNKNRFVKTIIPVTSARVPILKLTHHATQINCDLSFENRLSLQNTKMLALYLNFDVRIYRFMVLIRYWAKFHHLTGSNHIKNYALTLLVLVYLTKNNFVPPIELLQRLKAKERKNKRIRNNPDEIDGWDASFCDDVSVIKENFKAVNLPFLDNNSTNCKSQSRTLVQLALDFFDLYANLDFSKVVVCPLLGEFIPKQNFLPGSEETLPNSLDRYKNWAATQAMNRRININTYLCVQDPFVLSFNVGSVTPQGTLLRFQIACAKSLQVLRQRNGLTSLLDVLICLPGHIGEKKFMRTYRTEMKALELKKEIKKVALGITTEEQDENQLQASSSQVSSYVKLPFHLRSFDKLIDEKGLKQTAKRPRWELFLDFSLTSLFEDTLVTELAICQIKNYKKTDLVNISCTLWQQFTLDFLKEIFETGLKLTAVEKQEVTSEPYYVSEPNASAEGENGVADEEEKRKRWKVKMLSKQEEEKLLHQSTLFPSKSPEEVNQLKEKISSLPNFTRLMQYSVLKYKVTYPFWDRRPTILDKIGKEINPCEMVRIRTVPTLRNKIKKNKNNKGGKDNGKSNELFRGDALKGYIDCFNPVTLEAKVSDVVLEKYKTKEEEMKFTEFQFSILVKLDLTSTADRPEIYFVFEKDLQLKTKSEDYFRALQCIANILPEAFPRYQIYRLARWLDLPTTDHATLVYTLRSKNQDGESKLLPDKIQSGENNAISTRSNPTGEGPLGHKKKSTRTKLEEDLLIPSSSSSSCSESEAEGNGNDDGEMEEDNRNGDEDTVVAATAPSL